MTKRAFIVGFNTLGLLYSEKDAGLMASCLEPYGYEISLQSKRNKRQILEEFDRVTGDCSKTDTIIFYFSGHALVSRGKLKLVINEEISKNENLIDINEIISALESCLAINKAIILDCCHAGTAYAEWNPDTSDAYRMLTASEKLEKAKELEELKASFLTYQFYKALTDAAVEIADKDNKIHINALYEYLRKKAVEHNSVLDSIQVPIPNLLGNLKFNFEIGTISIPKMPKEKEYDKALVDKLVNESHYLYVKGDIAKALEKIEEAYQLAPYNSAVIDRYATVLFRRLELDAVRKLIEQYESVGKEKDDNILIVEGELLRREKKYKEAVKVLLTIKNRKRYNAEYLTGVCYQYLYGQEKKGIDITCALRHLRKANEYFPNSWFVKLNLAFTCMLCGTRDLTIEAQALDLLNKKIIENPGQVSPKLYRLIYFALIDDYEKFEEVARLDNKPDSNSLEFPMDFIDSTQEKLDMLYGVDEIKKGKYMSAFIKWATYFS